MNFLISKNWQLPLIALAAVLATLLGTFAPEVAVKTEILGEMFLNALKMMVLPLIVTSMIVGIVNLGDMKHLGSLGGKTIAYYMLTTTIAVVIGIVVVNLIKPGVGGEAFFGELPGGVQDREAFSFLDVLSSMVHPNLFQAAAEFKILPIIVASIIFGVAIVSLKEKAQMLTDFIIAANTVVMKIVIAIMVFAPIGIFGLIAHRLGIRSSTPNQVLLKRSISPRSASKMPRKRL